MLLEVHSKDVLVNMVAYSLVTTSLMETGPSFSYYLSYLSLLGVRMQATEQFFKAMRKPILSLLSAQLVRYQASWVHGLDTPKAPASFFPWLGNFQSSISPFTGYRASSRLWTHSFTGRMEVGDLNTDPDAQPLTVVLMPCSYIRVAGNCRPFPNLMSLVL